MDVSTTRIGYAVASDHTAEARSADSVRNGVVVEITRFDSWAAQPTAMAMICTGCFGEAVA